MLAQHLFWWKRAVAIPFSHLTASLWAAVSGDTEPLAIDHQDWSGCSGGREIQMESRETIMAFMAFFCDGNG